jgi:hypothetical protein
MTLQAHLPGNRYAHTTEELWEAVFFERFIPRLYLEN